MAPTVVVPVFNGFDATVRCLASLERHTGAEAPILLVDDGSTDSRIEPLLQDFAAQRPGAACLTNASNVGFTQSVNRAFRETQGDVVLLNSDCEVTAGWLEGLARCLASRPSIGIVCPLSNNATILSLPGVDSLLRRDDGDPDVDAIAECVRAAADRRYVGLPTAVGFCMLVSRRVIDAVGPLDAAYGAGYGEENDFSMRVLALGLEIACCDDVYVHHAGSVSFGPVAGMAREREVNAQLLDRRWPEYASRTAAWARANPLRPTMERINARAERRRFPGRLRALHVMHRLDSRGGIEEHTRSLVEALKDEVVSTIAYPRTSGGAWADFLIERRAPHLRIAQLNPDLETGSLRIIGHPANERDAGVEAAFGSLLCGTYDVVHFHSPIGWNTLALPQVAARSTSAVVVTIHDFSMLCADYNMMFGAENRPCGRAAARGSDAGCVACLRTKSVSVSPRAGPPSIATYLEDRYAAAAASMEAADAVVCPSEYVVRRMQSAFPTLDPGRLRLMEHGVHDLAPIQAIREGPILRAAYLGSFTDRKGAAVLVQAMRRLAGERVILEAWGPVKEDFVGPAREAGIQLRGIYDPAALPRLLGGIDVIIQPSLSEESFCLTLSEAQRMGFPVVASAIGAIPERVQDGDTGFLFPAGDVNALVRLLQRLRDERSLLERAAARLRVARPKTLEANAAEYLALYRELAQRQITPREQPTHEAGVTLAPPAPRKHTLLGDSSYDAWIAAEGQRPHPLRATCASLHVVILEGAAGDLASRTASTIAAQSLPAVKTTSMDGVGDRADSIRQLNRAIADEPAEWIVFVQAGDALEPGAFGEVAQAIANEPRAIMFYCDDDAMSSRGERYDPAFKPGFSAELLRTQPYLAGVCAVRKREVLERGGFDAPGWAAVVSFAMRLAREGRAHSIRPIRAQLVHRLDLNLRSLLLGPDHDALRAAVNRQSPRAAAPPVPGRPFNILLRAAGSVEQAAACIGDIEATAGHRVGEYFLERSPAECASVARSLETRGYRAAVLSVLGHASVLQVALLRATCRWLGVVDARIARFRPGWIESLEEFLHATDAAMTGCALQSATGEVVPGWDVIGAGPWSIAGPVPPVASSSALKDLYHSARDVSAAAARCAFISRSAANSTVVLDDLARAGRFDLAHIGLALREAGHAVLAHPGVVADYYGPLRVEEPAAPSHDCTPPPEVAWMRHRWGTRLEDDRFFHPSLTLDGKGLGPARRFAPATPGRIRVCAFPFDRWGSGEARVRQPCAALIRAGHADVLMMEEHDAGRVPNRLEWLRMQPDTLFAHNFFHDFQLLALDEYTSVSRALRVMGIDDLLTEIPPENPYAATIYRDVQARIARALSRSDRLVVSTAPLADAFGHLAKDVRVIPNAIDETRWTGLTNEPRGGERPRVGWAGARQHGGDLALLEPVVRATWREIDWVFFGLCPPELRSMACEVHDMVPVSQYPSRLAALGLDAAVAPLQDHPFNRAKSNLKLLEYGILGLPVVASDVTPYRGSPAILVAPSAGDWIDAVRALVADRDAGAAEGAKMRDWTLRTGSLDRCMLASWSRALDPAN